MLCSRIPFHATWMINLRITHGANTLLGTSRTTINKSLWTALFSWTAIIALRYPRDELDSLETCTTKRMFDGRSTLKSKCHSNPAPPSSMLMAEAYHSSTLKRGERGLLQSLAHFTSAIFHNMTLASFLLPFWFPLFFIFCFFLISTR